MEVNLALKKKKDGKQKFDGSVLIEVLGTRVL